MYLSKLVYSQVKLNRQSIIPNFKKVEKTELSSYRPISLLRQLSKKIRKSIDLKPILLRLMHADATNYITSSLDTNHFTMRIFIDQKKRRHCRPRDTA